MPTASDPMPIRPPSSAIIASAKPRPGAPSTASSPTSTPSNTSCAVDEPCRPSLSSSRPTDSPLTRLADGADDERGDAFMASGMMAGARVGHRPHHHRARAVAAGDPLLGAIEPPARGGLRRGRAQRGRVAARLRLAERERAARQLAGDQRRHPPARLLRRAGVRDQLGDHVGHTDRDGDRRVAARELHHRQRVRDGAGRGAAVLLGDVDAEQAEPRELLQLGGRGTCRRRRAPRRWARSARSAKSRAVRWTSSCSSVGSKFIGSYGL